jgi:hypothetical protein
MKQVSPAKDERGFFSYTPKPSFKLEEQINSISDRHNYFSRIQSANPPPRPRAAIKSSVTAKNAKNGSLAIDWL